MECGPDAHVLADLLLGRASMQDSYADWMRRTAVAGRSNVQPALVTIRGRARHNAVTDTRETTAPDDAQPTLERLHGGVRSDEATLTALYDAHRAELFGFLIRMTRDREAAEELLQDTFIRLIREARAGRMPDEPRAWLYRVAANAAISRGRHGAVWTRLVPRLVDRREPGLPEGEFLRTERNSELHRAMATLPPDARAALLLAARGFDGREIAASLGRTEGATRTLLSRSRARLRIVLEAAEGQA
jgi:RNA polymerase sigma factor (sigma-70 family)